MLVVLVSISDEATVVNEFSVAKNLQGIQGLRRGRALVCSGPRGVYRDIS